MWIQSMQENVLNNVSRYSQSKVLLDKLWVIFKKYKFNLHFDFIIWLPGEDIEKIEKNVRYIAENFSPYSISINWYDNTVDTLLYKENKDYFQDNYYIERTRKYKNYISDLLNRDYKITRKTTFYFDNFYRFNHNVIWIWAWAYWFINWIWAYKNQDYEKYKLDNWFDSRYLIEFSDIDKKVMFIIHNYDRDTLNMDYRNLFWTNILDDFNDHINTYLEKNLALLDNGKVIFTFKNNNIARFEFIDIYTENILSLY